ncbi:CobW family GTP-binding protein [Mangrovibacterium diazotrophicum]|uniref:G3E family GTPase n=1 Tax=Mangrovibacterium diazotrophicum TaxID=1261403 RepID=A0A419W8Q1_9BACT|nr:GTP-binding protein [Mangrovibacterium diazotrophicum]RKD91826.1 G3E family GTPase [Mangrovibacterium diazotrophicum]
MPRKRIPVTIITGFLGAGKTSLLNALIKQHSDLRFAIIENEFGEIGIDGALIVNASENLFELSNGCICCSLQDGFYATISTLLSAQSQFDHLLIETTGIADPDSVIQPFLNSTAIQQSFELNSVVCVADAQNLEDLIDEYPEIRKQLATADVVLLNKSDEVNPDYANAVFRSIALINPTATTRTVQHANIQNLELLNSFSYRSKNVEDSVMNFREVSFLRNTQLQKTSVLQKNGDTKSRHNIHSEGFIIPGSFKQETFLFWIKNFLFFNRNTIFRIKGLISFDGTNEMMVFQAVRDNFVLEPMTNREDETHFCKLVFIGKNIDRDKLEDNLYKLVVTENTQTTC